jgi:hypothetical protein
MSHFSPSTTKWASKEDINFIVAFSSVVCVDFVANFTCNGTSLLMPAAPTIMGTTRLWHSPQFAHGIRWRQIAMPPNPQTSIGHWIGVDFDYCYPKKIVHINGANSAANFGVVTKHQLRTGKMNGQKALAFIFRRDGKIRYRDRLPCSPIILSVNQRGYITLSNSPIPYPIPYSRNLCNQVVTYIWQLSYPLSYPTFM